MCVQRDERHGCRGRSGHTRVSSPTDPRPPIGSSVLTAYELLIGPAGSGCHLPPPGQSQRCPRPRRGRGSARLDRGLPVLRTKGPGLGSCRLQARTRSSAPGRKAAAGPSAIPELNAPWLV